MDIKATDLMRSMGITVVEVDIDLEAEDEATE